MTNISKRTRMLCEGALSIALAIALSYVELDLWFQGGSISAVMIPLVLFSVRWGMGWGILGGLVFGTLKYFLSSGWALNWVSIIFDYSLAYAMVGFSGLFMRRAKMTPAAAAVGGVLRFLIHYISGVTVYAQWMPEEFMGMTMTSPWIYSALYNGAYMLPSTILAVFVCALFMNVKPVYRFLGGEDLK